MKAKQYNKDFGGMLDDNDLEKSLAVAIYNTFSNMFSEVSTIAKQRNAKTNDALISIFNEMNQKANAFIKLANKDYNAQIVNDAFKKFVKIRDEKFAKLIGW